MVELGRLYTSRMWGREVTVQAISRDHSGTIHCRVYSPNTDWHGVSCRFHGEGLRKLDLPKPTDGWDIVRMVQPGERLETP